MSDDLPTFDRPEKAISGSSAGGGWVGVATVPAYSTVRMSKAAGLR
jgi:hypothetical protein